MNAIIVHGDIRHLEIISGWVRINPACSWRHTPFRNFGQRLAQLGTCSWRHTPFRN